MDDPGWSWPYWKFGLKKDDLFTKLHDQYNTVPSAIQDPEAFHHDVFEISHEAVSTDDFYRLMSDRKAQRLRELNDSLESAALEIISNPSLIGTEQWQYAVQLFRTKSLDSLVRYFSSYLPDDHPWHKFDSESSSAGSISETASSVDSVAHSHTSFFDDVDDKPLMTHEPLSLSTSISVPLPLSPRSMTTRSDDSAAVSPIDADDAHHHHHKYAFHTLTPARTMSFSGSESEACGYHDSEMTALDGEKPARQPRIGATPTPAVSADLSSHEEVITTSEFDMVLGSTAKVVPSASLLPNGEEDEFFTTQIPDDILGESPSSIETDDDDATPRPAPDAQQAATYFAGAKPSLPRRRHASTSPSRPPHPLSQSQTAVIMSSSLSIIAAAASSSALPTSSTACMHPKAPARLRRREVSPGQQLQGGRRRRGGVIEPANRIQKPFADLQRLRPRGRGRMDG